MGALGPGARRRWALALAAALVIAAACGGSGGPSAEVTTASTALAEAGPGDGTERDPGGDETAEGYDGPSVDRGSTVPVRATLDELGVDVDRCPPEPSAEQPIRIGVNGGGFTDSTHLDGLAAAIDEVDTRGGIAGRPVELVTSIEEDGDLTEALHHLGVLLDRGDLHAIVPWSGWPDPESIASRFGQACVPGLFWLAGSAPDDPWIVPGLGDRRAVLAIIAQFISELVAGGGAATGGAAGVGDGADRVAVVAIDVPTEVSIAESLLDSLRRRGIHDVAVVLSHPSAPSVPALDAPSVVVLVTPGGTCATEVVDVRRQVPDAVVIAVPGCEPYDGVQRSAFDGVIRPRMVPTVRGGGYDGGLATGRAVVAVLEATAEADGAVTRAGILRTARSSSLPGPVPDTVLRTEGTVDRFPLEAARIETYHSSGDADDGEWLADGPLVDAESTTPMTPIDRAVPLADEPNPCGVNDRARILTSHWFGDGGRLDDRADVVVLVTGIDLGPAPEATILATGADGQRADVSLAAATEGLVCDDEVRFDVTLGDAAAIAALATPTEIVVDLGPVGTTEPVTWPDDFPSEPPFDPIELSLVERR